MFIDGFGINCYKSFGTEIQKLGTFSKINLFIGQNNSGKSNILTFLRDHYRNHIQALKETSELVFSSLDIHIGTLPSDRRFSVCFSANSEKYEPVLNLFQDRLKYFEALFKLKTLSPDERTIWVQYQIEGNKKLRLDDNFIETVLDESRKVGIHWLKLYEKINNGQTHGNVKEHWIPRILQFLASYENKPPEIIVIPAIRRIGESGTEPSGFGGEGIIKRLQQLKSPTLEEQENKKHFQEINEFVRKVVGNATAELDIPHDNSEIYVRMDGKILPLSSLGTGIHEVIILAAAATVNRGLVLCIEEPELHLHPLLQRKLIKYLQYKTDNQYFITTHSAHLLDTQGASIFHIRLQDGSSTIEPVYTSTKKSLICADLGYRASDLLQANCVIWVEGPSDRIYLKHWIKAVDETLIEGIHYSIMFYGGRLLKHLTADDPEVTDFISLRRINRYISILIDSDRDKPRANINDTKRRIRDEFNKETTGFAWVTQGREIENYINPRILENAVKKIRPQAIKLLKTGQYDNSLHYKTLNKPVNKDADKVKVAHEVVKSPADLSILDLKAKITKLVKFIKESNDSDDFINFQV